MYMNWPPQTVDASLLGHSFSFPLCTKSLMFPSQEYAIILCFIHRPPSLFFRQRLSAILLQYISQSFLGMSLGGTQGTTSSFLYRIFHWCKYLSGLTSFESILFLCSSNYWLQCLSFSFRVRKGQWQPLPWSGRHVWFVTCITEEDLAPYFATAGLLGGVASGTRGTYFPAGGDICFKVWYF